MKLQLDALPNSHFFSIQQQSIRGTPDILGVCNGTFIALELKSEKGKPSPLQEHELMKVAKAKGIAALVYPDNWEETYRLLVHLSRN